MRHAPLAGLALLLLGCGVPEEEDVTLSAPSPAVEPVVAAPLPIAEPSPFESALGARMRAVTGTLVEVEALSEGVVVSHGSGVFVSGEGHVLTAGHVVKDKAQSFRVVLPDGQTRTAEVMERDTAHDAALLRAPGPPTAFARLAQRPLAPGGWVVCAGYGGQVAGDRVPMRTAGVVVQRHYAWTVTEYAPNTHFPQIKSVNTLQGMLRLDCATAPGMSGGPVVDLEGSVLGVIVGSGGVATPIEGLRHLLPPSVRTSVAASSSPEPAPSVAADEGGPSRVAAMTPMFAPSTVARSLIELEVPGAYHDKRSFPAVLVSQDGLVVAPSVWLVKPSENGATIAPESITVVGHAGAQCMEIVAVDRELALLRLSGLDVPALPAPGAGDDAQDGLRPVGPAGAAAVGSMIASVDIAGAPRSFGFVTALDRHPGSVAPDGPRWGCGFRRGQFHNDHPAVVFASALAHDAGWPRFGSLLVDRSGQPVAFAVASRATGLAFAVPWPDVTARFAKWLGPAAPSAPVDP